jgi:hypothetical protein
MFDLRSRAGIVGVATGAALLALPVVATGQVPVVDQVVGGVTQTAQSLTAAPVPQADLPTRSGKPAPLPAPVTPAPPVPAAPPAPEASVHTTSAPAPRGMAASAVSAGTQAPSSPAPRAKASDKRQETASAASGAVASDARSDSAAGEPDGATDVEIAAADSGDAGGPASLPFTGLQLTLLGIVGMAALAGGALLRRAARAA